MGEGGGVAAENQPQPDFPVKKLAPGEKPPQFVVVSFDGACKDSLFQHYMDVAAQTGAHYTFFLSGLCILPEEQKYLYEPPLKPAGTSAVGFGDATLIPQRIVNFTRAYNEGHEIGTHFLGHFCDAEGVNAWSADDWRSEMTQFQSFINNWAANLGVANPTPLPFNASVVKGDRTPCLGGKRSEMLPVFKEFGLTYDASGTGELVWPRKDDYGLWDFPLQSIDNVMTGRPNISMDYNFLYAQNNGDINADPAKCAQIEESTYESLMKAADAVYNGNRAPFFVGNHFNEWVCGAYKNSLTRFITDAHAKYPDLQFVSNADLEKWLEAQDPAVLASLQALPVQAE